MLFSISTRNFVFALSILFFNSVFGQVEKTFPITGNFQLVDSLGTPLTGTVYNRISVSPTIFRVYSNEQELEAFKIVDVLQHTYFVQRHFDSDNENPTGDRTRLFINFETKGENLYKVFLARSLSSDILYLRKL